jgi:hypothetical protein
MANGIRQWQSASARGLVSWRDRKWWSRLGLRVTLFACQWQAGSGGGLALLFRGCFARVSWARTRMAGFALSGVCLEAGRNRQSALRHHGQTHRGRVVCGCLAQPSQLEDFAGVKPFRISEGYPKVFTTGKGGRRAILA